MSYVVVTLPIGEYSAVKATADVFLDGVLTVTGEASGIELRQFRFGAWERATVFDANGYPLFSLNGRVARPEEVEMTR